MAKVGLFIDGGNMFFAQKYNQWNIDWEKVYHLFTDNQEVYGAFYFTASPEAGNKEKVKKYRGFRGFLIKVGYKVIDKELQIIKGQEGEILKIKGNLDIEMVFRMLTGMPHYDEGVIFGCDADYIPIIQHLRNNAKKIIIVGRKQSTNIDLINASDKFIDLNDIRNRIERIKV